MSVQVNLYCSNKFKYIIYSHWTIVCLVTVWHLSSLNYILVIIFILIWSVHHLLQCTYMKFSGIFLHALLLWYFLSLLVRFYY